MIKPIFIIGCPRSGTTITLKIMAFHEKIAWVSNFVNRYPLNIGLSRLNRIYERPYLGCRLYLAKTQRQINLLNAIRRYLPEPAEPWIFWRKYLSNFQWEPGGQIPPRRQTASDISSTEVSSVQVTVQSLCRYQRKEFFLSKYTDFPRIQYLTQAFPNAVFVHIMRDGRAVAASYLNKIQTRSFGTWGERDWWVKGWPHSWRYGFLQRYKTPLSFVTYQWKFFLSEIWKDSKTVTDEQYMEVNYRDIIDSPQITFRKIFKFCGLSPSEKVSRYLDRITLGDMNKKWGKKFTEEEKELLDEIIHEPEFKKLLD
jgi:hypothetical protein